MEMHRNGPAVQSVLDRTYVPPPVASQETIDFLEACQYVNNVQSVIGTDNVITRYRNMVASWANRKEKNSIISPSHVTLQSRHER